MKKSIKIGNQTFLHLEGKTLLLDKDGTSAPYPFQKDLNDKILDFWFDESERQLKVFTADGEGMIIKIDNDEKPKVISLETKCISASIYSNDILTITENYKPILLNFRGEIKEEYQLPKEVRFCLLTSQLRVLADSSLLFYRKVKSTEWKTHKFRQFLITHLINVNRQLEFGLTTSHNTRICHYSRPQAIFRNWAKNTVCLLQCPCTRHFYAHLDSDGVLRIGDNEADFTLQESDVTGICWEMGVLWARNSTSSWHRVVMVYDDQLFDMRTVSLAGMEAELNIQNTGQVINILEALKERPQLSQEIMSVLPPIAQNLTEGIVVNEVKRSLDAYIKKSDQIYELLGQIDLALKVAETQ